MSRIARGSAVRSGGLGDAIGGVRNQLGRLGDELSRWEKLGREIAFDG
jgi:hypothetical protein